MSVQHNDYSNNELIPYEKMIHLQNDDENELLDDKSIALDVKFLNNIPKSPNKLPKIKAERGIGNWQVCNN